MPLRNSLLRLPRALVLAALVLTGCERAAVDEANAPDTIYFNGKVVTVNPQFDIAQAFAVTGEVFSAVGDDESVRALAGPETQLVDLEGATVIPGLSDNHDHLYNVGRYLYRGVNVIGVSSADEMYRRLREAVAAAAPGETVFTTIGWNFNPGPTRQDLDAISADVPIVVIRHRRGVGIMNTPALAKLGISKASPTFEGAPVPVDGDGEPTGLVPGYPYGVRMIEAALPPRTDESESDFLLREIRQRHSLGITSIRDLALWPEGVEAWRRLQREGRLKLRVAMGVESPDQGSTLEYVAGLGPADTGDAWLTFDSVAEEPWTPGTVGVDEYTEFLRGLARLGWRAAPHASSDPNRGIAADDAADLTLQAYAAVDSETGIRDQRWYLEHVPFAMPPQIARMAELGLVVSTQAMGYYGAPELPMPEERLTRFNPTPDFLEQGVRVIGGSDYNGPNAAERNPNNPMIPFYFYVTRKTVDGEPAGTVAGISRGEALRIFTVNPAYAAFREESRGQIAPGMLADFVVLDRDLLTVPEEEILATRPLATYIGGEQVYAATQEQPVAYFNAHSHILGAADPEIVVARMRQAGLDGVVLMLPDPGMLRRVTQNNPDFVMPFVGIAFNPEMTGLDLDDNTASAFAALHDEGFACGFGEIPPRVAATPEPDDIRGIAEPRIVALLDLAASRGVPINIHFGIGTPEAADALGRVLAARPQLPLVLAHAGLVSDRPEALGPLLEAHPNLYADFSGMLDPAIRRIGPQAGEPNARSILTVEGHLQPGWRALIEKFPDRFLYAHEMTGSETQERIDELVGLARSALGELPPAVEEAVAHGNARRLFAGCAVGQGA